MARETVTSPSSSGWRSASQAARENSGSSSRNSTPWLARQTSPGRGTWPPPTRPGTEMAWWGARNGRRPDEAGVRAEETGGREHLGDLERLVLLERREQAGEAPGQHGLAGAGRAGEEQVVGAGGGDLEGPAGLVLASDVGEVLDHRHRGVGRRPGAAQLGPADQPLADLLQRGGAGDPQAGDERGLDQVGLGDDQEPGARPAGGQGGRQHPLDRADVAAEAELADRPQALEGRSGGTHPAAASRPIAMGRSNPEPCLGRSAGGGTR